MTLDAVACTLLLNEVSRAAENSFHSRVVRRASVVPTEDPPAAATKGVRQ